MKRIILSVVIILSVAVALTANVRGANQPAKPLVDFLIQPPNSIMQLYGYSEETFRLYNIFAVMQLAQRNESQITSLRSEVTELKKTVKNLEALVEANTLGIGTLAAADPNDLKETRTGGDK